VSVVSATVDEALATVIEAAIPGDNPHMATERLYVDNETLLPIRLIIFDSNGAERIVVIYNTFEYNVNIAENTFQIQQ
jgi:outer membrane lipoprotein-sorting protein